MVDTAVKTTASRQFTDPCDNLCTTASPCRNCKRADKNKDKCCQICARLAAYQRGEDWTKYPAINKIPKIIKPSKEILEIVDFNVKGICIMPGCNNEAVSRELCGSCFSSWSKGKKKHPLYEKFFKIKRGKRGPYKKKAEGD